MLIGIPESRLRFFFGCSDLIWLIDQNIWYTMAIKTTSRELKYKILKYKVEQNVLVSKDHS